VSRTTTTTVNVCVPQITQHPANVTINGGQSTTLTVAVNLTGVTYQWYSGASGQTASPIAGATAASLSVTPSGTSTYWARVTSSCGRTTDSTTATVTVCTSPAITIQPSNAPPTYRGYPSGLAVMATGTNLTYQWYAGASGNTSSPVAGATTRTLSLGSAQNSEHYWVRVSGSCGSVNSAAAMVSVYPQIMVQPQSDAVMYGYSASLAVSVSGSYLTYQWYQGESGDRSHPIGTNSSMLDTAPLYEGTAFWVSIRSGAAETLSQGAWIDVQ
jgi:hypothetical protein